MRNLILLIFATFLLIGCEATTKKGGGGGKEPKWEKGASKGKEFLEAHESVASPNELDGLWRNDEITKDNLSRQDAFVFNGANILYAAKCTENGFVTYALTRTSVTRTRNKISISQAVGYIAEERDPDSKTNKTYQCIAELPKGEFYFSFIDKGYTLCLSSSPKCRGNKSLYFKIRDSI